MLAWKIMGIRFCWLLFLLMASSVIADAQIRDVQEELRKRNMYFGDVDGQMTPELVSALKRYQERKGFQVTGAVDETTAQSLQIQATTVAATKEQLPPVPVLRSDTAVVLDDDERQRLAQADEDPDAFATPAPPAEEPPASQNIPRERVQQLVEQYLRDSETMDIAAQTRYFAYPVAYFKHGMKDAAFVERDVRYYCKRWTQRQYALTEPVSFSASTDENETNVQFTIEFNLRNKKHHASGKTKNFWTLRAEGDELKIVAIHEERLRD
jgi:hypothetical protein